ncbi:MAG: hypothetical protein WDZ35_03245 [Crocinitomicaceae bacterium]
MVLRSPLYLIMFFLLSSVWAFAQKVKEEKIEYNYVKLPKQPLDKLIKNYSVEVFATYEADNAAKLDAYTKEKSAAEEEFRIKSEQYPAELKAAEDQYEQEMKEYNEKGFVEKVVENKVLKESTKPVKHLPPKPVMKTVKEPELQTTYDYPVVANTYLRLGGYENKDENAVHIKVTLYGYDYTEPRQMTIQKNVTNYSNGKSSTRPVNYYYTEFSYRHPMSVTLTLPDGTEIFNETPQELNTYTVYKSKETESRTPVNRDLLIKTTEEKIFQANLTFLNDLVNDKFGYQKTGRTTSLYYVKSRDDSYSDLMEAFNESSSGLKLILDDEQTGREKLEKVVKIWNSALNKSEPDNRKALINADITTAICFNLLEVHFALKNTSEAEKIINRLNTLKLSSEERKQKDDYVLIFSDLKNRIQANN